MEKGNIRLRIPEGQNDRFADASRIVSDVLADIDALPVLPSEVEDILPISPRERQKWKRDDRLRSDIATEFQLFSSFLQRAAHRGRRVQPLEKEIGCRC